MSIKQYYVKIILKIIYKKVFIMTENRKWFKGSRDRGLFPSKVTYINNENKEYLKINNLIRLIKNNENFMASWNL